MKFVVKNRASAILFNLLKSNSSDLIWLIPSNCCPIVPITFLKANKRFELIDINNQNLCIDENIFWKKIYEQPTSYAGMIYIDNYGIESNPLSFFQSIKKKNPNFLIIHDKCLSKPTLSFTNIVDATLYSTGYSKYVDLTIGGYAIIVDEINYIDQINTVFNILELSELENIYKKAFQLNQPLNYKDSNWLNLSDLDVSDDRYFEKIEQRMSLIDEQKIKINNIYSNSIPDSIQLSEGFQNWRFNILVNSKDILLKEIFSQNLFASSHYNSLAVLFSNEQFQVTNALFNNVINLFNDFHINETQVIKICTIINKHIGKYGSVSNKHCLKSIMKNSK